jgi:hypothetical protein
MIYYNYSEIPEGTNPDLIKSGQSLNCETKEITQYWYVITQEEFDAQQSQQLTNVCESRCDEVDQLLEVKLSANFSYGGYSHKLDSQNREFISATASDAIYCNNTDPDPWDPQSRDCQLYAKNESTGEKEFMVFATSQDFIDFSIAFKAHINTLTRVAIDKKDAIRALAATEGATEEDLNNYNVNIGW